MDQDGLLKQFDRIAVILVRPAGNLNIGATARAMMNTGFRELILVDPVDYRQEEADRMAVTARPILDAARIVPDLSQALSDRQLVFGVTARSRHKRSRTTPFEAAERIEAALQEGQRIALVFGPEDHGLSAAKLDACSHLIGIPAHSELTSYNLAQAVLLVCHALFLTVQPRLPDAGSERIPADHADRERVEARILDLLEAFQYLTPNRETVLRDLVKRVVYRAPLETRDVRHILAVIRHLMRWPDDSGA